jgi:Spy/CpxP family protein refolding chaperone
MRVRLTLVGVALVLAATVAFAQTTPHGSGKHSKGVAQPYAGQQTRGVAMLSDEDVQAFLDGRGMGLARSAELNGHPGPMHVLELDEQLKLTAEQRYLVKAAFDRMMVKARELGEAYVKAEQAVDAAFKSGTADSTAVAIRVAEANRLLGEVRLAHLNAHIETTPLLTPEQRARYAALRGYDSGPAQHRHKH